MKRIIALGVASAISVAVHAGEVSGTAEAPILMLGTYEERSQARQEERKKAIEALEAQRAHLGELERLAVPIGVYGGPSREQVLPYRFSDVSKLQAMLRDPEWKGHWHKIAATIAMVADKKAALELINFIKSSEAPAGYEHEWNGARATAISALGHTLIDQDVPEVLEFLKKLTDDSYAESLNFESGQTAHSAQSRAFAALAKAANDDAIAVLERALSERMAEKERKIVRTFSVSEQPREDRYDKTSDQISKLEMYLDYAKRERAGIEPEPSNEMP